MKNDVAIHGMDFFILQHFMFSSAVNEGVGRCGHGQDVHSEYYQETSMIWLNDSLLRIKVNNTLDYHIFIHDLKYFYATSNQESEAPSVRNTVFANELPFYFPVALTEVEELDVHHDRCNKDLDPNTTSRSALKRASPGKLAARQCGAVLTTQICNPVPPSNNSGEWSLYSKIMDGF